MQSQPTASALQEALTQIQKGPMLFAGVPSSQESEIIAKHRAGGGRMIYFMTEEEKKSFVLGENETGVLWSNDGVVKQFLFDNIQQWMGGQIGNGVTGDIGASEANVPRAKRLASILLEVVSLWQFDTTSAKVLFKDGQPYKNMLKNHRWVEDGFPFKAFKGRGKGITTIIVAAGPSLDAQWEHLARIQRDLKGKVGFIVCGRSYKRAMDAGIQPDFVQEVEQFDWNDRLFLFAPKPPQHTVLVGPLSGCPNIYHAWPNAGRVCITWDHNYAQTMGAKVGEESMDGGNSILHHMFNFAVWLGSDTIGIAGADLSYPPGCSGTHAVGTFHQWDPAVWKQEHARQEPMEVPCTSGGTVTASQPYRNFGVYMEIQISKYRRQNPNLRVLNFCPNGQLIAGTEYEDIAVWGTSPSVSSSQAVSPLSQGPVPFVSSLGDASMLSSSGSSSASLPENASTSTEAPTNGAALTASDFALIPPQSSPSP